MTKMVALRITVPADDRVPVTEVAALVRKLLRDAGTCPAQATLKGGAEGGELPLEEAGMIFLLAADVKQGALPNGPRQRGDGRAE